MDFSCRVTRVSSAPLSLYLPPAVLLAAIHADVGRVRKLNLLAEEGSVNTVDVTSEFTTAWSKTAISCADCVTTLVVTAHSACNTDTTLLKLRSAHFLDLVRRRLTAPAPSTTSVNAINATTNVINLCMARLPIGT